MTRNSPELSARAREIALELTSWPSVTGTAGEAAFAQRLQEYLRLRGFDEGIHLFPVDAGANPRSNSCVLKRGRAQTIVLTGHFDTVPYDDYGALSKLWRSIRKHLRKPIINRLAAKRRKHSPCRILKAGDFLAGARAPRHEGRIGCGACGHGGLCWGMLNSVSCCLDEEETSAGARAAAACLEKN